MATTSTTTTIRYEKRAKQVITARFSSTLEYTYTAWTTNYAVGKIVVFSGVLNYADFTVDDSILVAGTISDRTGATAQVIGLVTGISGSSITAVVSSLVVSGGRGARMRGVAKWSSYKSNPIMMLSGADGEEFFDVVMNDEGALYLCKKSHMWSESIKPDGTNTYWSLADNQDFVASTLLMADYGVIENLGVRAIEMYDKNDEEKLLFAARDGVVTCNTGNFKNVNVEGDIKANYTDDSGNITQVHISADGKTEGMEVLYNGVAKTKFTGGTKSSDELFGSGGDVVTYTQSTYISDTTPSAADYSAGEKIERTKTLSASLYDTSKSTYFSTFYVAKNSLVSIVPRSRAYTPAYLELSFVNYTDTIIEATLEIVIKNTSTGKIMYEETLNAMYDQAETSYLKTPIRVEWDGCSISLASGSYSISAVSALKITVGSDGQPATAEAGLGNFVLSIDPAAYQSIFFGNGFAFGTSQTECFQSVNENNQQSTRCLSGTAGWKVENNNLYLRINGKYYSCAIGSDGASLKLTEVK